MYGPRRLLTSVAWPPHRSQCVMLRPEFRRYEQLAKRQVRKIGSRRGERDFGEARYLHRGGAWAVIGNRDAANLGVVFRRNGDLKMRFQIPIAAAEIDLVEGVSDFVGIRVLAGRLKSGRPNFAGRRITDVNELSPVVGAWRQIASATPKCRCRRYTRCRRW